MSNRSHRRVRWRVRRCPDGWLAIVLIGEEPMTLGCLSNKHDAKLAARQRAMELRAAYGTTT